MGLLKQFYEALKDLFFTINSIFWLVWLVFTLFRKFTKKYVILCLPLTLTNLPTLLLLFLLCLSYIF